MINNVVLMGRIASDIVLRQTTTGKYVTTIRLAVERNRQKKGEEKISDFFSVCIWDKTAEFVEKYFSKGDMIAITGDLQTRIFEDGKGNKKNITEIHAENVSFCGSKKSNRTEEEKETNSDEENYEEILSEDDLPFR